MYIKGRGVSFEKIGIIGGTFDPPHYGHLLIANEVYHALNLEEVWFLNQIPPHKQGRNITSVKSLTYVRARD